jgi:hypothetical protein
VKRQPIKNKDYDNINRVLDVRLKTWQYRLAREELLARVYKLVLEKNGFSQLVWCARAYGPDIMTETGITVNWTWYYPFVIGDPEYDERMERYANRTYCKIFFHIQGDEPGRFKIAVHYDYQGKDGLLQIVQDFDENKLAKSDLTAPIWFKPYLDRILKNNAQFHKK